MARRAIVAANWKMNGNSALVETMVSGLKTVKLSNNVEVVMCPSSPYLAELTSKLKVETLPQVISVGAQNVSEHKSGAYTGEVSTDMLQELSVKYVIVGHSERRSIYKETSSQVAHKVHAVLNAGLTPILCIGESEAERATEQTETVLASQLQPVIDEVGIEKFIDVVIAYEPVWAIGTGVTATDEQAQDTQAFVRSILKDLYSEALAESVSIQYGGSMKPGNAEGLLNQNDIDGGLIGGAALNAEMFAGILSAGDKV